jgi:hypothetical protein
MEYILLLNLTPIYNVEENPPAEQSQKASNCPQITTRTTIKKQAGQSMQEPPIDQQ